MGLRLHNTLTRRREEFVPRDPGRAAMYFCGPTPYSHTHVGHLRPALTGDILARYLKYRGYAVFYVSNFTDVDDKIIQRAEEEGVPPLDLSARYAREYLEVLDRMGMDQVNLWVKVTDHMPEIVEMVDGLLRNGLAYRLNGDVYYHVPSFPGYGKLSGRRLEELLAGARVAVDERKRHPMDFALWKAAKPGEPSWPSPWGHGRPGWHIECSAMSIHYLGDGFDIHGGGEDLIFPHHENEIAQAEGFTGRAPFVRFWVHNGLIHVNREKMSKSLGNFVTAGEILRRFSPQAVRLFMLSTHYRHPLDFSWEALEEAERAWERVAETVRRAREILGDAGMPEWETDRGGGPEPAGVAAGAADGPVAEVRDRFVEAMDDDLNTARALGVVFDLVRAVNAALDRAAEGGAGEAASLAGLLEELVAVLGFHVSRERPEASPADGLVGGLVELVLELRQEARLARQWERADYLRARLAGLGIEVEDTPQGSRWRR